MRRSRAGVSGVSSGAGVLVMVVLAVAIVVGKIMPDRRILRRPLRRRFFVGRLFARRIFVPRVAVAVAIVYVARFVLPLTRQAAYSTQRSATAVHLVLALTAQRLKIEFLIVLHRAAGVGVFTVALPALRQLSVLALVQRIHLVVELLLQLAARVWSLWLARAQRQRRAKKKGTGNEGISPLALHGDRLLFQTTICLL